VREAAKRLLDQAVRRMPDNVAIRVLNVLRERYRIGDIVINSKENLIEGTIDDWGVFRPIMLTGSYKGAGGRDAVGEMMRRYRHGTYIDIGANIGMTTIPLARQYEWDFYAFEPEPTVYRRLRCNLVRNGVDAKVQSFNMALSDRQGPTSIKRALCNQGDNWLAIGRDDHQTDVWDDVPITADTLDSILGAKNLSPPIVVKIDTQGAEPLVVKGGQDVLSRAELIAMEFWPQRIVQMGNDPLQFFENVTKRFNSVTGSDLEDNKEYGDRAAVQKRIQEIVSKGMTDQMDLVLSSPTR
jgi:FkbM family methyltransferase